MGIFYGPAEPEVVNEQVSEEVFLEAKLLGEWMDRPVSMFTPEDTTKVSLYEGRLYLLDQKRYPGFHRLPGFYSFMQTLGEL